MEHINGDNDELIETQRSHIESTVNIFNEIIEIDPLKDRNRTNTKLRESEYKEM